MRGVGRGVFIINLDDVKIAKAKALDALKASLAWERRDQFSSSSLCEELEGKIAAVEAGTADAVETLCEMLDAEGFHFKVKAKFIHLYDWCEDGCGRAGNEGAFLAGVGDLFEAGGRAWVTNRDDGEECEYRYLGGSYEYAWAWPCYVSKEDRARVREAFSRLKGSTADRKVLRDALIEASFLEKKGKGTKAA